MWLGFAINACTGALLLIAYPTKALTNPVFYLKLAIIGFAVWVMHMIEDRVFGDSRLDESSMMARGATSPSGPSVCGLARSPRDAFLRTRTNIWCTRDDGRGPIEAEGTRQELMSFMHLHLLLNHFPIIGSIIALGLFLTGFVGKNEGLRRASLILFVALALLTLPTFFSGIGARAAIKDQPGISAALMDRHEGAAMLALFVMEITGALALVGLWRMQRAPAQRRWSGSIVTILIFSILTVGLMARVGNTGGDIRHPEIRFGESVNDTGLSAFVHVFEPSPDKFTELMLSASGGGRSSWTCISLGWRC